MNNIALRGFMEGFKEVYMQKVAFDPQWKQLALGGLGGLGLGVGGTLGLQKLLEDKDEAAEAASEQGLPEDMVAATSMQQPQLTDRELMYLLNSYGY